eukprot:3280201-Rhodomonas_salina.1
MCIRDRLVVAPHKLTELPLTKAPRHAPMASAAQTGSQCTFCSNFYLASPPQPSSSCGLSTQPKARAWILSGRRRGCHCITN